MYEDLWSAKIKEETLEFNQVFRQIPTNEVNSLENGTPLLCVSKEGNCVVLTSKFCRVPPSVERLIVENSLIIQSSSSYAIYANINTLNTSIFDFYQIECTNAELEFLYVLIEGNTELPYTFDILKSAFLRSYGAYKKFLRQVINSIYDREL